MSANKSNTILFRINRYRNQNDTAYRVLATIPGFSSAYLVKPEGDCSFPNRSAALKAIRRRAVTLGLNAKIISTTSNSRTQKNSV
jgi:hypothetical protein